ncbi:MAG: carboxypeptidase regulatory-like domain-containing protein, partial [Candidatus Omnitrophica bacterium]|nr:carboxypeptidase regulatory-like domain-containing protein [Candidatus Omnitrophota bacterium]
LLLRAVGLTGFLCFFISDVSQAEWLRLLEREEGNEVEVLEEQPDAFIVKIPESEVAIIKGEAPAEIKLWREKKILWEDLGDYLVISLPKERIAPPPASADNSLGYATAASLAGGLAAAAEKGQRSATDILSGNVRGRVLRNGFPLVGVQVRLTAIEGSAAGLTRLLGGKPAEKPEQKKMAASTITDSNGAYFFKNVPLGDYDIAWLPPESTHWQGWLSDKPDVTVKASVLLQMNDIEL